MHIQRERERERDERERERERDTAGLYAHAPQTASTYILGWVNTHVLRLDTRAHTQLCAFVRAS